MDKIKLLDVVALTIDIPEKSLCRGQDGQFKSDLA